MTAEVNREARGGRDHLVLVWHPAHTPPSRSPPRWSDIADQVHARFDMVDSVGYSISAATNAGISFFEQTHVLLHLGHVFDEVIELASMRRGSAGTVFGFGDHKRIISVREIRQPSTAAAHR